MQTYFSYIIFYIYFSRTLKKVKNVSFRLFSLFWLVFLLINSYYGYNYKLYSNLVRAIYDYIFYKRLYFTEKNALYHRIYHQNKINNYRK